MSGKLHLAENLSLPAEAVTQTFAILAKRGVGKTYTAAVMTEEMLRAQQQVVVVDPIGVWWGLRSSADGKEPGFAIVVFGGEHGDVPLEEHAGEIVAGAIIEHGFSAVLDLSMFRKAQQVRFMTAFAETLYRLNRKPLHLMVDEADAFAPQRPMRGEERLLGAFEDIVRRGRARGLGVTLITQRAAVLNKNVLTQIEVLVALRTISPQDREALEAWVEVHGTQAQKDQLFESIASLPIGTAWFWSPGWLDVFKRVEIRRRTTFDSSATPKVGETVRRPKALAEVNLNQLGAQIKETAEKARENDPSRLRRVIVELRQENRKLKDEGPAERKEVPVLTKQNDATLNRVAKGLEKCAPLGEALKEAGAEFARLSQALTRLTQPAPAPRFAPAQRLPGPRIARPNQMPVAQNGDIAPRQQKILDALALFEALAVPEVAKRQLALFCGVSPKSSGYQNDLGALRTAELIHYPAPSYAALTPDGRQAARASERIKSLAELHALWTAKLPPRQADIFRVVLKERQRLFTKDELAELVGKSPQSSGYQNDLGALRTLGVIEYPQPGCVRVSELVFPPLPV